jgi:hypothetical protein
MSSFMRASARQRGSQGTAKIGDTAVTASGIDSVIGIVPPLIPETKPDEGYYWCLVNSHMKSDFGATQFIWIWQVRRDS